MRQRGLLAEPCWQWRGPRSGAARAPVHDCLGAPLALEPECRLAFPEQLDIDAREQKRILERAVLAALRMVDPVALAQRIEAVGPGRMAPTREKQRIDHA